MALKYKLTKAQYEALSDEMKNEYVAGETAGEYIIDLTGAPEPEDTGPLQRALESERTKVKDLTKERNTLKAQVADMPDVAAIEAKHNETTGKLKTFVETTLVDAEAMKLATKISSSPALILPHIKSRLAADLEGDTPTTKVKDKDGKFTAEFTLEKLGEEFVANKDFSSIIIASKGTGGGKPLGEPTKPLGSGTGQKEGEQPVDFSKLPPKEFAAHLKAKREAQQAAQQ